MGIRRYFRQRLAVMKSGQHDPPPREPEPFDATLGRLCERVEALELDVQRLTWQLFLCGPVGARAAAYDTWQAIERRRRHDGLSVQDALLAERAEAGG